MSAQPIISVAGLRGIVGESLTPEVVVRYAAAFAAAAPPGAILVSRDGRGSGRLIAELVHAALEAMGRPTADLDVQATPTVGVAVRHFGAAGAIQITASHNPPPYNGLKLFSPQGRVLPHAEGQPVLDRYRAGRFDWAAHDRLGTREAMADPARRHLEAVLELVDVDRIYRRGFRVLLDANHGAGAVLGRRLLEELGCELIVVGEQPDGQFEHPPEPTAENLADVPRAVVEAEADVGFCQDPDADRLALIDHGGRYIGEEYTVALCAEHILSRRRGPIVINTATSRMNEEIARRHGVPIHRAPVGEAHVVDAMLEHGAVFGGEGNGGPIDPRVGPVRDSFVGMALVLDAMARRNLPLAALADELPRYEIVKTKYPLPADRVGPAVEALIKLFPEAQIDRRDGLRLQWPDRWLLLRASNTEPIVRAIAEAPTAAEAQALCDRAANVLAAT